jgi:hypothetical protein
MDNFSIIDKTIMFCGKRCSGKSYLLKHLLLSEIHLFSSVWVCCPTEAVNSFYQDIVPAKHIFDSYEEDWGNALIKRLTQENSNKVVQKKVLLILDDLIADINFHSSKTLRMMYSRGRHIGLSIMLTTQYLNSVSPLIRNNTDYLFVAQQNRASVELLAEQFMNGNITKKDFMQMYYKNIVDYGFLCVNCTSVKDSDLNSLYGVIRTPAEEMNKTLQKIKIPREPKVEKPTTTWSSLFGSPKEEVPRERNIVKHQYKVMKPDIQPICKTI